MFKRFEQPKLEPELEKDPRKMSYSELTELVRALEKKKRELINEIGETEKILNDPGNTGNKRVQNTYIEIQTKLQEKLIKTNKLLIKAMNPDINT